MSMKKKLKNFFYLEDQEALELDNEQPVERVERVQQPPQKPTQQQVPIAKQSAKNVVQLQSVPSQTTKKERMVVIEPRSYEDMEVVGTHIKENRTVVINLHLVDYDQRKRIIDFLSGAVFVADAELKPISREVFLCSPFNVEVEGDIKQIIMNQMSE